MYGFDHRRRQVSHALRLCISSLCAAKLHVAVKMLPTELRDTVLWLWLWLFVVLFATWQLCDVVCDRLFNGSDTAAVSCPSGPSTGLDRLVQALQFTSTDTVAGRVEFNANQQVRGRQFDGCSATQVAHDAWVSCAWSAERRQTAVHEPDNDRSNVRLADRNKHACLTRRSARDGPVISGFRTRSDLFQ